MDTSIPSSDILSLRIGELERQIQAGKRQEKKLGEHLRFEKLLSGISYICSKLPVGEVNETIENCLKRIGEFMGADRCTLAQLSKLKNEITTFHAWTHSKFPAMPNDLLNSREFFPWSIDKLKQGQSIAFNSPDDLPDDAAVDKKSYISLAVHAHTSVPIEMNEQVVGALSISVSKGQLICQQEWIQRLRLIGEILSSAFVRKQKEVAIQSAFTEIKQLKEQLEADCSYLREEIDLEHNAYQMIGESPALLEVFQKIRQIGPTDTTVLIHGETGTGKELVARAIHAAGRRSKRPMVKVNCAALPTNLIESELFGREKGAYTGAQTCQTGRFEFANDNTLFLDEIGELPLESQAKLLRVLQDGEFERLGSSKTIKVDVRIISATNRNLKEDVDKGRFRQDLWYRLNIFPISVPPLRERDNDISLLTPWLVKKISRKMGKSITRIPAATMKALKRYHWPGNVRELENVIERAVINSTGTRLQLLDTFSPAAVNVQSLPPVVSTLQEVEINHIVQVLKITRGRIDGPKGAALILGLNPSTLRTRMRKLGIQRSVTITSP